jgi:site-specific recombinase XerD
MADSSVAHLKRSFELHLRAENKAVRTIETYLDALQLAARFLEARGVELEQARHEDIEAFIADQLARWKPATATNRYRSLRVFYGWLEAEGEIPVSPMAKMRPPAVPDQLVPLVREDAFRRLLEASAGRDFEARRDTALACSWSTWARAAPRSPGCASPISTSTSRSRSCSVMVAGSARSRSVAGRPGP